MTKRILTLLFVEAVLSMAVIAQAQPSVIGTWKLVSAVSTNEKGATSEPFGKNPIGFITYTAEGRMSVIINSEGRKPLSTEDRLTAPVAERAEAFSTMAAYAGRYDFTGDKVVHHVEASYLPNAVGTDLVRAARLEGNRLTLRTPPMPSGGELLVIELVWERLPREEKQ